MVGRREGEFAMDRGNTKQEILEASLNLFSVQGFESTSISQIASAVGIRKASLYSHLESKQAILDAIVKDVLEQYGEHSIFARTDWVKDTDNLPLNSDEAVRMIQKGILAEDDPEIMAVQLCLPISVWINLCDREPDREQEVMELVDRHIRQFFRLYQTGNNEKDFVWRTTLG